MARTAFVAGNWKMNLGRAEARELAAAVATGTRALGAVDVAVAPPAVWLADVAHTVQGTRVALSAQNMHPAKNGAYTGELAPPMLTEVGCRYVILGHSERREYFGETDAFVNQKVVAALAHDLSPIVCVGETLDEREAGQTRAKVDGQVRAALSGIRPEDMARVTIAYEPIWAIGTGRTASPEQAQEVHAQIRSLLVALYDHAIADAVRIQYGGSVKADNIAELYAQPDIDGALVGGASLKADSFLAIVTACAAR